MKQINGEKINKIPLVRFLRSLEVLLFHEGVFLVIGVIVVIDVILLIVLCRFYCCYSSNYSMKVYACLGLICFVPSLYFFTKVSKVFLFVWCPSWQRNMKISCVSSFTVPLFQKEKSTESSPSISRYNSLKEKTIIHNLHLYHLSIYIYPLKGDEPTLPVPQLFWRPRHLVLIFYRNSTLFVFFYRTSTLLVFFYKKNCSLCFLL